MSFLSRTSFLLSAQQPHVVSGYNRIGPWSSRRTILLQDDTASGNCNIYWKCKFSDCLVMSLFWNMNQSYLTDMVERQNGYLLLDSERGGKLQKKVLPTWLREEARVGRRFHLGYSFPIRTHSSSYTDALSWY